MSKDNLKFAPVTDLELLDKTIFFLSQLRNHLPYPRLFDCCGGACALIFELSDFLRKHPEYHGNY